MKITKYPQSAILLEYKGQRILIDPGSYCYNEKFTASDWGKIDILLLTHEHSDHCLPEAIKVIADNNPEIIILSNYSVQQVLSESGIGSDILKVGEIRTIKDIEIKGVQSIHGDLPNGKPKPEVLGFLIDNVIYHPGDTIYLSQKPKTKVLFVPICGVVVMNPKEAAKFSKETEAEIAIPIHYDNPGYPVDVNDFKNELGENAKILKNGESLELDY